MTNPADFEKFQKWAATSMLKNDDEQVRIMWEKISRSEDLVNHFLDLPKNIQESVILNLSWGLKAVVLGVLYRLGLDVYKIHPAHFSFDTLIKAPATMRFPTTASTVEFGILKRDLLEKLDLADDSKSYNVVAWREIEIRVEIFELLRIICGEDLTISVMESCLKLDTVPFPDTILRAIEDTESRKTNPLEWVLLTH